MNGLLLDLKRAARGLVRSPAFTIAACATLALGIGATSAVVGIVRATFLQPPPFPEPNRLVVVSTNLPLLGIPRAAIAAPLYEDMRQQTRSFESLFAFKRENMSLSGDGPPQRLSVARVSAGAVSTLELTMTLGRGFVADEDVHGGPNAVVIAHPLWRDRYGSDPDILGRTIRLDGKERIVVGVLPATVVFPYDDGPTADVWIPVAFVPQELSRGYHDFKVVGRLRPEVSRRQLRSDLATLVDRVAQQYPDSYDQNWSFNADSFALEGARDIRGALLLLQGAVVFVLLIACLNVANLLVARFSVRRREIAVHRALGASGARILRLTLSESLLIAVAGGALGWLVANLVTAGLVRLSLESFGPLATTGTDMTSLLVHTGLSLLSGLVVGLIPAFRARTYDLSPALHERDSGQGRPTHRLRAGLMVLETALALVLLVGAGLLVRSLGELAKMDPGFRTEGVMAVRLSAPASRYGDMDQVDRFFASVLERLRSIPGVEEAGAVSHLPLSGDVMTTSFMVEAQPPRGQLAEPHTPFSYATPGYFEAFAIRLVSGRTFTSQDTATSPPVIVINEAFASSFWPGQDALGRRIAFIDDGPPVWREVVGVVGSVRLSTQGREPEAAFHLPVAQRPFALDSAFEMNVVVSTTHDPETLLDPMRAALQSVDPDQPFYDIRTVEQMIDSSIALHRVLRTALSGFALAALALAAIGIYGVIAYTTGERRREFGIRLALGARGPEIVRLVLEQSLRLTAIGLAAGLLGSLALSQSLRSLLYDVHPLDPQTYLTTTLILAAVAIAACLVPAIRATRVDPAVTLRME